jgi:hypothetical protein
MKRYMVIETFVPGGKAKIYERFHQKGRMLPEGLTYIDSWLTGDGERCFQLMETNDRTLFAVWAEQWDDLVKFEIVELGDKPQTDA